VCVSGLTTTKINIEDFLAKQWSDAYIYMIKFTDNNKAFKNLSKLSVHSEKIYLIEYLFDSESRYGGPKKIEIFENDDHKLDDFSLHSLEFFLESTREIRESRPHNFIKHENSNSSHRSHSKSNLSK
jgi:hypothetical protein